MRHAGSGVGFDFRHIFSHHIHIVSGGHAHKETGPGASQVRRLITGIFDGLPGDFQKNSLLGVHQLRFFGGDAEKQAIEFIHLGHKPAPLAQGLIAGLPWITVPVPPVPAIRGDFGDQILPRFQVVPEAVQIG